MLIQLLLVALSVLSLGCLRVLLDQPYRPEMAFVHAPTVIFTAPDTTTDWIGLV